MPKTVAVVGGGMAGLSATHQLKKSGIDVTLFEQSSSVGGRTQSRHISGFVFDEGAVTLSSAYRQTIKLMEELGAADKLVFSGLVLGFVRDNKLHELDLSRPIRAGLSTKLLSPGAKLKLLKLFPLLRRYGGRCHFESMADLAEIDTESCRDFALRELGVELHDYFVDPIIKLNMFNSTSVSSMVDLMWLMKIGAAGKIVQARGGMGEISRTVASTLEVRFDSAVEGVEMQGEQVVVRLQDQEPQRFDGAIIATPPPITLELAPWLDGPLRNWFGKIKGVKSLAVQVGLSSIPDTQADMILVSNAESGDIIGICLDHKPDRVPAGKASLTLHMTWSWAEGQLQYDDETIARHALACAAPFLGDLSPAIEVVNIRRWEYVDHSRYVGIYKKLAEVLPAFRQGRVQFAGEYISAGVEGAVTSGLRCAESLAELLKNGVCAP